MHNFSSNLALRRKLTRGGVNKEEIAPLSLPAKTQRSANSGWPAISTTTRPGQPDREIQPFFFSSKAESWCRGLEKAATVRLLVTVEVPSPSVLLTCSSYIKSNIIARSPDVLPSI